MTRPAAAPDEAGATLAREAARFASFGWMRGTSGNLSMVLARDPLRLAVTASGLDKSSLSASDVVVVDGAGRAVDEPRAVDDPGPAGTAGAPRAGRPSAEAALHARVARIAGANAVVHVHTVASVVAGRRWPAGIELAGLEMLKGIGLPASGEAFTLPVIENSQDMTELGDRLEAARHPRVPAVVVADHGLYAWGADVMQARHHTEIVQWLLEVAVALS
jgi:methylthioribulose-1-phosphate dehydratase